MASCGWPVFPRAEVVEVNTVTNRFTQVIIWNSEGNCRQWWFQPGEGDETTVFWQRPSGDWMVFRDAARIAHTPRLLRTETIEDREVLNREVLPIEAREPLWP